MGISCFAFCIRKIFLCAVMRNCALCASHNYSSDFFQLNCAEEKLLIIQWNIKFEKLSPFPAMHVPSTFLINLRALGSPRNEKLYFYDVIFDTCNAQVTSHTFFFVADPLFKLNFYPAFPQVSLLIRFFLVLKKRAPCGSFFKMSYR